MGIISSTAATADTLWIWFYRSLPVLVLAMLMLGIIK